MHLHADSERCSGCRACLLACSLHLFEENNPKKAALEVVPHFPDPGTFEVRACDQCGVCADVCLLDAVYRDDDGTYIIDPEACGFCGVCIVACPEQAIHVHPSESAPFMCDSCGECIPFCGMNVLSLIGEETS